MMEITNNINTMTQLEENLNQSADAISKINVTAAEKVEQNNAEYLQETDLVQEMVNQITIPLAYTANAEVISTQDSVARTLLDIKA